LARRGPDAKTFGAVARYLPDVNDDYDRKQQIVDRRKDEHVRQQAWHEKEKQKHAQQRQLLAQWRPVWESLTDADQERIRSDIRQQWPHIARLPEMFDRYCIQQLARERSASPALTAWASDGPSKSSSW
jgi:catalase